MKKIAIIFNGGTISMKIDEKIKAAVPSLSADEIMSMIPGVEDYAEIEAFFKYAITTYDFGNNA